MSQANKQDMENKWKGVRGERERPTCVPRASSSCFLSVKPSSFAWWNGDSAWYFFLLARNHRVTKSVGCHKWAKPGGERWLGGGWGAVEKRGCKGRQLDPSGPDKTEWKTDDCGEHGGEEGWSVGLLGGYTVWRALSASHLPPFFFSPLHRSISAFLSRLKQQFVAWGKNEREEEATKDGVFPSL